MSRSYNFTQKAVVKGWTVAVDPIAGYGYFEPPSGEEGGGLWFQGGALEDYDGYFALPEPVVAAIRQIGYVVGEEFE